MTQAESSGELRALLDGAAALSRAGNRVAAIVALLSAIKLAPDDRTAHRHLAAAYAVGGDRCRAREEYERFAARLEASGATDAALLERTYASVVLAPAPLRPRRAAAAPRLTADQSFALRRVAVAILGVAASLAVMFAAGAQIFAHGG